MKPEQRPSLSRRTIRNEPLPTTRAMSIGKKSSPAASLDDDRLPGREGALECTEARDRQGGGKRARLRLRQAVRGERNECRGFGNVANDADPLEPEPATDRGAGAFEHRAGAKLPARQRARQRMERLELNVRLVAYGNPRSHHCRSQP